MDMALNSFLQIMNMTCKTIPHLKMNKYNLSEKHTEEELKNTCDHIDIDRKKNLTKSNTWL